MLQDRRRLPQGTARQERHPCPRARRVAHRHDLRVGEGWDQPDGEGAFRPDVVAKGPGQVHAAHVFRAQAEFLQQDLDAGADGPLRQLQFAHVPLRDDDRPAASAFPGRHQGKALLAAHLHQALSDLRAVPAGLRPGGAQGVGIVHHPRLVDDPGAEHPGGQIHQP